MKRMIFCCEHCRFLFLRDFFDRQCPDCGKFSVRAANEEERSEFKRIQIVNAKDDWTEYFVPQRFHETGA